MTRCTPVITHNKHISTPPTLAGLFFCLASAEGAGLLFLPSYNTAPYKRLQRVLRRPCNYTTHAVKQRTGFYRLFSCDCARSSDHDTRLTQAAIIPPVPRWSACPRLDTLNRYQIPDATPRRCTAQHSRPIIIMHIRARRLLWIHDRRCNISQTMQARRGQLVPYADRWQVLTRCQQYRPGAPADGSTSPPVQGQPGGGFDASSARRLAIWHRPAVRAHRVSLAPSTRRGSPAAGARRAARNHWRLSPHLFSGFRPISNRGQQ